MVVSLKCLDYNHRFVHDKFFVNTSIIIDALVSDIYNNLTPIVQKIEMFCFILLECFALNLRQFFFEIEHTFVLIYSLLCILS